jgi:hypothetical protein
MSLKLRPEEVTVWNLQITHCHKEMGTPSLISTKGTLGMACSILLHEILSRNLSDSRIQKAPTLPVIVRPRFSNFPSCDPHEVDGNNDDLDISGEDGGCSFSELRAGRVGQMVYSYIHTYIHTIYINIYIQYFIQIYNIRMHIPTRTCFRMDFPNIEFQNVSILRLA